MLCDFSAVSPSFVCLSRRDREHAGGGRPGPVRFDSPVGVECYITLCAGTSHRTFNYFNGIRADLIKGFEPKKLVVGPADLCTR